MIASNPVHEVCDYGSQALYSELPTPEQVRAGVIPLDSLPAAWWNAMWNDTNKAINEARGAVGVMVNELCNVLVGAGICPSCSCLDQLYQSIDKIRQTLATATVAGAVKSSSNCGEVSVDGTTGIMTANGLGNAAQLATSARTTVGAINELKQIYDCCISDINSCTGTLGTGKAPTMHAVAETTYGVGNATCYGHVRLSDTFDTVLADCSGVAASQYALATAYQCLIACSGAPLGNTVGCALGIAAAGTASTAARSDHVHPLPTCLGNSATVTTTTYNSQVSVANCANACLSASASSGSYTRKAAVWANAHGVVYFLTCNYSSSGGSCCTTCIDSAGTFHGNVCGCWNGKSLACVEAAGWTCFSCPVCYCYSGNFGTGLCVYKNACTSEGRICIHCTNLCPMQASCICAALQTLWPLPTNSSGIQNCTYAATGHMPFGSDIHEIVGIQAYRCAPYNACFGIQHRAGRESSYQVFWLTGYVGNIGCSGFYICKPV